MTQNIKNIFFLRMKIKTRVVTVTMVCDHLEIAQYQIVIIGTIDIKIRSQINGGEASNI